MGLISNVNFSNQEDYQAIYSSQLYGTFFAIYGKFTVEENTAKDKYLLKKVDLKIVNYKGLIDIKITKAIFEATGNEGGIIKVQVRAIFGENDLPLICNGEEFLKGGKSFLHVDRRVMRLDPNSAIKDGVFDEEFFYREGVDLNTDSEKTMKLELKPVIRNTSPMDFTPKGQIASPGGSKCPKAKNAVH